MGEFRTMLFTFLGIALFFCSCSSGDKNPIASDDNTVEVPNNEEENNDNQIVFDGETWTIFNKDIFSVDATNNRVTLNLEQNALWYQANTAGLLYQTISGDFTISAKVMVRRKSNETLAPACNICLGGLTARNPNTNDGENYVHLVSGNTPEEENDGVDELGVEHKSTANSVSAFDPIADGSSDHELRIIRQGTNFSMYSRSIDASEWNLLHTYSRTDLPETLQVGLNIYTATSGTTADLMVIYEDIIIE